jgi:hypothetical protein
MLAAVRLASSLLSNFAAIVARGFAFDAAQRLNHWRFTMEQIGRELGKI